MLLKGLIHELLATHHAQQRQIDQLTHRLDQLLKRVGEEISEELDYTPSSLFVRQIVRPKYVVRFSDSDQPDELKIAELPPEAPLKSKAAPGLVADVIVSKLVDQLPLYRREQRYARQGFPIARSTLCGWLAEAANVLTPLWQLLKDRVLSADIVNTDDTPVPVQDPARDRCRTGRIWVYVSWQGTVYDATADRSRDGPLAFLNDFRGYQAGRLRLKLLWEQDFRQIVFVPGGDEEFVFDADFRRGFVFQQAECGAAEQAEVGVGVAFSHPALIFSERHIKLPVQTIFNPPMSANRSRKSARRKIATQNVIPHVDLLCIAALRVCPKSISFIYRDLRVLNLGLASEATLQLRIFESDQRSPT